MSILKVNTVQQLQECLNKFDSKLPISVFDKDQGYMSVAFKKEEKITDGKKFQWLTFYAHETLQMYTIDVLKGYLSKLPPQAMIAKKTEDNEYTDLYLSIESMRDNGKYYHWLVLSDELEYDRFFRKIEQSYIDQALNKMLVEIKTQSSQPIERIHQWLCKQTEQELFKGIMTERKTLKGAYEYCTSKAKEQAKNQPSIMIEDDTIFEWVSDYFIKYELPKEQPKQKSKAIKESNRIKDSCVSSTHNPLSKEKGGVEQEQLDLFAVV